MANAVAARASVQGCRSIVKPSPFKSPVAACRHKNVFKERSESIGTCKSSNFRCDATAIDYPILSTSTGSKVSLKEHALAAGVPVSQISSSSGPFMAGNQNQSLINPVLPSRRQRSDITPKATSKDMFSFRIPVITEKPEWWWRTLACVPYLIALKISDVAFYLQPLSEHYELFENLIYYVPGGVSRFPGWFTMIYCFFAYIKIVKNKNLPHFFRFHLMMGMLMETSLQIAWYTFNFAPYIHYNGTFGMHFWAAMGFAYITVFLYCVKSALSGEYVNLPFISDAAFIHTLFNMGGFQRPF